MYHTRGGEFITPLLPPLVLSGVPIGVELTTAQYQWLAQLRRCNTTPYTTPDATSHVGSTTGGASPHSAATPHTPRSSVHDLLGLHESSRGDRRKVVSCHGDLEDGAK